MMRFIIQRKGVAIFLQLRYGSYHISLRPDLTSELFNATLNIENTLQAYPPVCRRDAQTGGFILFGGCHALS